jgi:hypothetical protein
MKTFAIMFKMDKNCRSSRQLYAFDNCGEYLAFFSITSKFHVNAKSNTRKNIRNCEILKFSFQPESIHIFTIAFGTLAYYKNVILQWPYTHSALLKLLVQFFFQLLLS